MDNNHLDTSSEQASVDTVVTKSKNQLKNETKRQEKMTKFLAKQEKLQTEVILNREKSKKTMDKPKNAQEMVDESIIVVHEPVPGQKKDFSLPMASSYHPKAVESGWYSWWERIGIFKPETMERLHPDAKPFVIPIPPPNVTGSLHLGHALATSLEDVLIRWKRMQGYKALYIPGCDHAGISCQVVVEKHLKKTRGLTRHDLGREHFVAEVWKWKESYGNRIYEQFKKLGGSMDWDRVKFTMDPSMNKAVIEAWVRLFENGTIYRDNRLVNWCSKLQTTVSDLEVDHLELTGTTRLSAHGHDASKTYEFGTLTKVAYKLAPISETAKEETEEIIVCTTRPETIPGDVAVAVHSNDSRYVSFHGRQLIHPLTKARVPLILDPMADMSFGTGAVKLTPAHDPADFEAARRHSLPIICIMDEHNRLNEHAGPFVGMMRFDAREAIIAQLKTEGLYRGSESHVVTLPICNRSGDIIEPRLLPQWWMRCSELAHGASEAVRKGDLKLYPVESEKVWFNWMDHCRDWCLSRQLWWGHRVPAYSVMIKAKGEGGEEFKHVEWVAGRSYEEALEKARSRHPGIISSEDIRVEQDPDVLDTWFSSALWPFATLGWPDTSTSPDFSTFYPASVLETGRDIIFFWVARMVMLGLAMTERVPFHTVFLHSIIRDAHGRKMSKSLGNVIDPLDVISGISLQELISHLTQGNLDAKEISRATETLRKDFPSGIKECGTDALRFALCNYVSASSGNSDINLDINRIEGYRRFCNKIWNVVKFALMKLGPSFQPSSTSFLISSSDTHTLSPYDQWILFKLVTTINNVNSFLSEYNFMKATSAIYNFIIYDLCDVYVEAVKPILSLGEEDLNHQAATSSAQQTLFTCIEQALLLLHPFMPFITEELYHRLPCRLSALSSCYNSNSISGGGDLEEAITSISLHPFPHFQSDQSQAIFSSFQKAYSFIESLQELVVHIRSTLSEQAFKGNFALGLIPFATDQSSVASPLEMTFKPDEFLNGITVSSIPSMRSLIKGLSHVSISQDSFESLSIKDDLADTTATTMISTTTFRSISVRIKSINDTPLMESNANLNH